LEKKEINPQEFTSETIENFLGKEKVCLIWDYTTNFGDGPTIFTGQKVDGEQVMAISLYQKVYNNKVKKFFEKILPTIMIQDYRWSQESHNDVIYWYVKAIGEDKIIERVEKIEMTDEKIVFQGTTGQEEKRLEIYKDGTYLYIKPSLKLRDNVPNAIKEVETLRGHWVVSRRDRNKDQKLIFEVGSNNRNN
jgi:hypothetical protein